jgi:alanine racemase
MNNHVTKLNIDLNSLAFNLNYFKKKLSKNTKILAVVKAFGYGSSAVEVSKFLADKIEYFAVAYLDEGIALRKAGITTPILVLHPVISNFDKIIEYQLEPNIYSFKLLNSFLKSAKKFSLHKYAIHLKFNTGLNRLGFNKKDVSEVIEILKLQTNVKAASLFSHVAASEDLNERNFTIQQINSFKDIITQFGEKLGYSPIKHMLNTSGIINYANEAEFDMVRLGIGLYGFGNDINETSNLKNVFTLKSIISQIHILKKGDSVGYNRAFKATKTIKSATIPIGHADGIYRKLGNKKGYVYVNNKKAAIIGNVCMDMIMIDVTNITCEEGDEVIIYKNQQHIEDLAKLSNTIPYEIITSISQRICRVVK